MEAFNVYGVTMIANDNSVNIEPRAYHHGDLRVALVNEGLRLLAQRGGEAPSLREVARGVGVSATSVYRHFPDKEALMTALALEGLVQLADAQRAAADGAGGGDAGFAATGRAYVRFALANPALFRLIFTSPALSHQRASGVQVSDAGALLHANAAKAVAEQGWGGDANIVALRSWAFVHGLAMLMLDGQIPEDDAMIDRAIC